MKRPFLFLTAALFVAAAPVLAADPRAAGILEELAAEFRAMPAYKVTFEIISGDYSADGSYAVAGNSYYLTLGDAEVFADAAVRYEVDNRRREVTINEVDTAGRNILNNPIRAFDFLGSEYTPELLGERDGAAQISLTPTSGAGSAAGKITVTVSTNPVRPQLLFYDYDGEHVTIRVTGIAPMEGPLRRFDPAACKGYEMIDFR